MYSIRSQLFGVLLFLTISLSAQTWGTFTTTQGLSDNQVRAITGDSSGTVWIGTRTKGLIGYNGTSFVAFPKNGNLPQSGGSWVEITGLNYIDNKLYIGTKASAINGGLYVYDFAANSLTYIGNFEIIGSTDIRVFFKASSGQIYAGTGGGIYKRNTDASWTRFGFGYCQSITETPSGIIYYTTYDSLFRFDGTNKIGMKSGTYQSVVFDNAGNGYVSNLTDVFKFRDTTQAAFTLTAMNFSGYSKAMARDVNGKVWIVSASTGFGVKVIDGATVTTYNTGNSPLLSADMTSVFVGKDNRKYFGHFSAGLNSLTDAVVVLPCQISPVTANLTVGATKVFGGTYGTTPYRWGVVPANLGTLENIGTSATFRAQRAGTGFVYVLSATGTDTAKAAVSIADTGLVIKLPPTSFVATKGKYTNKVDLSWVVPGEFKEGFEDGLPINWKTNPTAGQQTSFLESGFTPAVGAKCIKFDVYSPGAPISDMLVSEKIHISPEKPNLKMYIRTAYALGNTHSSYIKISTTNQNPASFTTTAFEMTPSYLADSNLQWRTLQVNLSAYINQDIYLGFQCRAEDIIIYFDEMEMTGQSGLTAIGRAVRSYKVYRALTPVNLQNNTNVIKNALITSMSDTTVQTLKHYFYAVSAVYDSGYETPITSPSLGVGYAQIDSVVLPAISNVTPVVDGVVNSAEYADGYKTILTRGGYWADLYMKQSGNSLYIGVDYFGDSTLSEDDYLIFAFDKNRDFTYQDSVEGYYRIRKTATGIEKAYFPFDIPFGFVGGIPDPAGFAANVTFTGGKVQYEMSINLGTSYLSIPANKRIGAFVNAFNVNKNLDASWLEKLLSREYSVLGFPALQFPLGTDIEGNELNPTEFVVMQNYPNPFNPSTNIRFSLPEASDVVINVYNSLGEQIQTIATGMLQAGRHQVVFNGAGLPSGLYIVRVTAGNHSASVKMNLLK